MGKKKELIVQKGYTLTVSSWENDGDYSDTNEKTYDNKEDAIAMARLLTNCISGIANDDEDHEEEILEYLEEHADSLGIEKTDVDKVTWDLVPDLLGSSEYYTFRVPETVTISYSPEDIYLETVNF